MRGTRIPTAKRIINNPSFPPLDPADLSEANAEHLMFLWDNMGTGEFLEDAAILGRHLRQVFAREQATPNLTLEVQVGVVWFTQQDYVAFAGGDSPVFTAPTVNPRRDILTLRNDGTLQVLMGAEAASPVPPIIPSTDVPLAQIFSRVGQTKIRDNDTQEAGEGYIEYDLRPFVQVAVGASAMPKIGIIARVQASTSSGTLVDVVNFTGAGRLRLVHFKAGGNGAEIKVVADGVTLIDSTATLNNVDYDLLPGKADTTSILKLSAATADPAASLDIFFKDSLLIQHTATAGSSTTTAEYERE